MITYYYNQNEKEELEKIEIFKDGAWIDFYNPTPAEIELIVKKFQLNQYLIEDALDEQEVPRMEIEEDVVYLFTRVPETKNDLIITVPLLIIIGADFIITFSGEKLIILNSFREGKEKFFTAQKVKFLLEILYKTNNSYNNFLLEINKKIRKAKIRLEKINNKDIIHFIDVEKTLNDFLFSLMPTEIMLNKILAAKNIILTEDEKEFLQDVQLDTRQLIETMQLTIKYTINIRNAYSNIMTNKLNRIMKLLTAFTVVLAIPTMIFSFYGMNVLLPGSNSLFTSAYILIFSIALSVLFLVIYNKWL